MVKGMSEGHGGFSARSEEVSLFGLCLNLFRMVADRMAGTVEEARALKSSGRQANPQSKCEVVSNVLWDLGTLLKDKKSTWHKK